MLNRADIEEVIDAELARKRVLVAITVPGEEPTEDRYARVPLIGEFTEFKRTGDRTGGHVRRVSLFPASRVGVRDYAGRVEVE